MIYDFDYFGGKDLQYPKKPKKPQLKGFSNPTAVRIYADNLEKYEKEIEYYNSELANYKNTTAKRMKEFQDRLRNEYYLTDEQFDVLWNKAWDMGHSSGLNDVFYYFDDFYEMATEFAALDNLK